MIKPKSIQINDWVDEYHMTYKICKENGISYMNELTQKHLIIYRFTILLMGIYCDDNIVSVVNRWLKNSGFEPLSFRNRSDALFLYTYGNINVHSYDDRFEVFKNNFKLFSEWVKEHHISYKEIITLGDLTRTLMLNSSSSESMTMRTMPTSHMDMSSKILEYINSKKNIADFLDYLESEPSISAYNKKATYYMQKILFDLLKFPIDILCEHNLPKDPSLRKAYIQAKNMALKDDERFNRYTNYNRLFIEEFKKANQNNCMDMSFREWFLSEPKKNTKACVAWLSSKHISYERLFTNIFNFFMMQSYNNTMNDIKSSQPLSKTMQISDEQYELIYGKSIDCRTTMRTTLRGFISGNMNVSRTFLIMFAFYAGYNRDRINNILGECNFSYLNSRNNFDNMILDFLRSDFINKIRDIVNNEKFIDRIRESYDFNGGYIGIEERDLYYKNRESFQRKFNEVLSNSDDDFLASIFEKNKERKKTEEMEKELKKITSKKKVKT